MKKSDAIYVAGHRGMVGSAVVRKLKAEGYAKIITATSSELDLRNQQRVYAFLKENKPKAVVIAAAKVGGILANDSWPYTFIHENVVIQDNLIHGSHLANVEKLVFLGSSCIYPKFAEQPMSEESLLTGPLEPTNQWYAIAKIAGVKTCQALRKQVGRDYLSLMPTNLYGPNDNFDLETSHVLPAMIRKFYEAAQNGHADVTLWGSGTPKREFLHVDDVAGAVLYALKHRLKSHLYNVGTGRDISIKELAELIQNLTGHEGNIFWDSSKPDGTPRKLMDVSRFAEEGWEYSTGLKEGIKTTIQWYSEHREEVREVRFNERLGAFE
jgi:GDP-L-fucose synthase